MARGIRLTLTFGFLSLAAFGTLVVPDGVAAQEEGAGEERIDTPYRWIERSFRVGFVGGYLDASRTRLDLGPGNSPVAGLRSRVRVSSPISLEFGALVGDSDRPVVDPRLEAGPAPVDTASSTWLLTEAAMQFALTGARTWHGLHPYVLIGGGFLFGVSEDVSPVFDEPDLQDFRHDIEIMPVVKAGVGTEWLVNERWGISFELRDHLWRITTPEGFFEPEVLERIETLDLAAPEDTDWTHNLEFSVGVWRYF